MEGIGHPPAPERGELEDKLVKIPNADLNEWIIFLLQTSGIAFHGTVFLSLDMTNWN